MELEDKIKQIREKEDLSQETFAECLGVSRQTVINWEKGKNTPNFELLMLIANSFHIEINSLVQTNMEPQYLSLEEKVKSEESIQNQDIKQSFFDPTEKPIYIPKQAFFSGDVKYSFLLALIFAFESGMFIWVFSALKGSQLKWLFLIFIIGFSMACLYSFINFILAAIKKKKGKCYLYQNHFYIEKGLKEKEYFASAIDFYTSVKIEQSLMGKIFNYGDIHINFQPKPFTIWDCKKPYKLKKFIQKNYACKEDFTQ